MKSPFSPWFGIYVLIGACGALFVYASFTRHTGIAGFFGHFGVAGFDTMFGGAAGVVRSVHEDASDERTHAVVALDDGAVVDGPVAPGCLVFVGDRVIVQTQRTSPSLQKNYLVIPQNLRHKD